MTQFYLISPPKIELQQFLPDLRSCLETGLVGVFQLRLKDITPQQLREIVPLLRDVCHEYDVPILLNDYVHVAHDMGCDGVHLGQGDMPIADARTILGGDKIIGVTCHNSKDLAYNAAEEGAEYVAFGAFYPTATKDSGFIAKPNLLRDWSDTTTVPCVAIGGITADNCAPLIESGADFIAVLSAVWHNKQGVMAGIEAFRPYISVI